MTILTQPPYDLWSRGLPIYTAKKEEGRVYTVQAESHHLSQDGIA